jgi:Rad3-related DNA helicase
VPVHREEEAPLEDRDLQLVDEIFQEHLPALAAAHGSKLSYRPGQHQVAREVARTLGKRELLLVHAPTGTGKTLAYLVPALIWAARANRRVAISTYTRTLQEQAMTREVPRALAALERAGFERRPRVTSLKGRSNYLCWRALKAHVPAQDDDAAGWLAWSALAIFAMVEPEGDLDRFAPKLALTDARHTHLERELEPLVRAVRAQVGCCHDRADRRTCAAEIARARAEHAHVVVTNHAFALARQDFFKNVIFDECEHLHDQAHGAWSSQRDARARCASSCARCASRERSTRARHSSASSARDAPSGRASGARRVRRCSGSLGEGCCSRSSRRRWRRSKLARAHNAQSRVERERFRCCASTSSSRRPRRRSSQRAGRRRAGVGAR